MSDDLISVRILAAFGSARDRDLLRGAAAQAALPTEIIDAEGVAAACDCLAAGEIDVALFEAATAGDLDAFAAAAKAVAQSPFVILIAAGREGRGAPDQKRADGAVTTPTTRADADALIELCARLRLPGHVLVVDDSATTRSIIRKLLSGARFSLSISEAEGGVAALQQLSGGRFDLVLLDDNMPGLTGVETLAQIRRGYPQLPVVMMSVSADPAVAERALAGGAAAFLRKPFFAADVDAVLLAAYGLRGFGPSR